MRIISRLIGAEPQNLELKTSADLAAFLHGGIETWTGMQIGIQDAQKVSSWFAANANIAIDIGKLPFVVYRSGEARERATNSPYWRLVHDRWSTRWTSQQGREFMTFWAQQDGDAYALKNIMDGQVREMIPFKRGEVQKDTNELGEFVYKVKLNGRTETLSRREVFHLEGFAMNWDGGAQLFKLSREDISLALASERHGAAYFGNGGTTSGGLKIPGELSDQAYRRLKESLEDIRGSNAWNPLLLEGGAAWEQFGLDMEKSQFLETRKFQVSESARRVRTPPHKVGDMEHATFSNIEHQAIEYVQDSLLPWALRWENAFNYQVIGSSSVYAEMLFEVLLRGDSKTRSEVYASAVQNGWMTENEIRRRENLPPLPGGDVLLTQSNLWTARDRDLNQLKMQVDAVGGLIKAGFEPTDSLAAVGLRPIAHTGRLPVTVQGEDEPAGVPA